MAAEEIEVKPTKRYHETFFSSCSYFTSIEKSPHLSFQISKLPTATFLQHLHSA